MNTALRAGLLSTWSRRRDKKAARRIMFGIALRRCGLVGARACAPSFPSVGSSPLVLSRLRCAGTVSGRQEHEKSVELADFFTEIGVPNKDVVRMAGIASLQQYRVPTLRDNYSGLVAILGAESALGGIVKSYVLLTSPSDTTAGAHVVLVDILGADGAAAAILKNPDVLRSPAATITGAHEALVDILGADGAAEAILKNPGVLRAPADTMKGAHKALADILGADGAAAAILKNPNVLRSPADTIKGAHEALVEALGADGADVAILQSPEVLRASSDIIKGASEALGAHLGKDCMLQAVVNNPMLLTKACDKIHQTAAAIKDLLGESEGTDLLKEKPRLFVASAAQIVKNFETLCNTFDPELVLKFVQVRPTLLYDRAYAEKAVKARELVPRK